MEIKKDFVGTTHGTCASEERPGGSDDERIEEERVEGKRVKIEPEKRSKE